MGRPPNTNLPAVVKAILYLLRAGCPWRMLPWEFPPCQTVYGYFHPGATRAVGSAFTPTCAPWVRLRCKRPQSPWVAIADTQSVPLGCLTHRARGFEGGKRVKGRKRHVLVDSMGLFLAVVVTAAKLTSKGCRRCCVCSSSGEAGSIGCGSSG
ncbi:MAG: IS5/IS1182 family transposase, partial [Cyanobacteria bacterium QS_4_48_99]